MKTSQRSTVNLALISLIRKDWPLVVCMQHWIAKIVTKRLPMDILVLLLSQVPFSSENMVMGKGKKRGCPDTSELLY